ncbi:MAG: exoribonuclease II [Succinivibrio sp.]
MLFDDPALSALKKQFNNEKPRKEGTVKASDRGFGFLETADRESFFIAPDDMRAVTHGDRISATIGTDSQGREHAVPESLVEPFLKRFVARAVIASGRLMAVPDHPSIRTRMDCDDGRPEGGEEIRSGDWVVCELTAHALRDGAFRAKITERICSKDEPRAPWIVSLRRYDLPLHEPADRDFEFLDKDLPRKDLTALPFVTIDSSHTQDMDDALCIEKDGSGYTLMVAIADPTGYIAEGSDLDELASRRAFSIYLPGQDIPMLPRILSQNLCSLREGEDRPVVAGRFRVALDGTIDLSKSEFCLGTIRSQGKLVYDEISDYLEGREGASFKPSAEVDRVLRLLEEFARARDGYRATHAASFRNRPDYDFVLKEDGSLDHIEVEHRRIANQIVEECMITANVCAGNLLAQKFHSGIFNLHKGFDLDKIDAIKKLLDEQHCPYTDEQLSTIEGYNAIRRFAVAQGDNYMDCRIRRLQEFSQISIAPGPHFALGVENYATWTSPIRKYGDMVNHRLLKSLITSSGEPKLPGDDTLAQMNLARRVNRMAERDVRDWLYVDYLEPEIARKTVFDGEVFDIMRGGMRVTLDANGAMIFVPFSFMSPDRDSMTLDGDEGVALVGGKVVLKLGDPIRVRLIEVDHENRSITGAPAESIGGVMLPVPEPRQKARPSGRPGQGQRRDGGFGHGPRRSQGGRPDFRRGGGNNGFRPRQGHGGARGR